MTAAARAALRRLVAAKPVKTVAVRLPAGFFLPVDIHEASAGAGEARAWVIKDGGDDPDATHKARIGVRLRLSRNGESPPESKSPGGGVRLTAGEGVGVVTKAGLPVAVGEPAVNPGPRAMLAENLAEELRALSPLLLPPQPEAYFSPASSHVFLPLPSGAAPGTVVHVEVEVADGEKLASKTLNPRLGILGGISILGTTGIVKPFSHRAYEETIESALSVARSSGSPTVVLSTGGKSERLAKQILPHLPEEAFVQIADFFAFSVRQAAREGFASIVHSVFFGKAVKMAQGHAYTHAHKVDLDLAPLSRTAGEHGYDEEFRRKLEAANTARHALELLREQRDTAVIRAIARQAAHRSARLTENRLTVRLLLFDYDGALMADVAHHAFQCDRKETHGVGKRKSAARSDTKIG